MKRARFEDPHRAAEIIGAWLAHPTAERLRGDAADWGAPQWRAAARAAEVLGIGSLLHAVLVRHGALRAVDRGLRRALIECQTRCRARAARLAAEIRRVLALAARLDVPLVLLGDTAAAINCGGIGPTPRGVDAHLLVRPAQETRFTSALQREGWGGLVRRVTPSVAVFAELLGTGPRDADAALRLELDTSIDSHEGGLRFDLTWSYWYEARRAWVLGVPTLAPAPLRLLQYLLVRASARLMLLELPLDALWNLRVVAAQLDPVAWGILTEEALNQDEARLFWTPLRLAERAFGPTAPPTVLAALQRRVPAALRDWVEVTTPADWAARRFHPEWPADWSRWCRSPWERTLAARRLVFPLPSELGTPSLARGYLQHLRGLLARAPQLLRAAARPTPTGSAARAASAGHGRAPAAAPAAHWN